MQMRFQPELNFLVFLEGDTLVAQGVDYDIGAQADGFSQLIERVRLTMDAESRMAAETDLSWPSCCGKPPARFRALWDSPIDFGVTRISIDTINDTHRIVGIDHVE